MISNEIPACSLGNLYPWARVLFLRKLCVNSTRLVPRMIQSWKIGRTIWAPDQARHSSSPGSLHFGIRTKSMTVTDPYGKVEPPDTYTLCMVSGNWTMSVDAVVLHRESRPEVLKLKPVTEKHAAWSNKLEWERVVRWTVWLSHMDSSNLWRLFSMLPKWISLESNVLVFRNESMTVIPSPNR